ncbi:MAG: hypothetical protein CMJ11_05505 [Pelagibacterales bacterium]|nr:hypothetical protein [Pelagibacterales bacterium]
MEKILLTYIQIVQLISFTFLMSLGQVLFKKTAITLSVSMASQNNPLGLIEGIIRALSVPWLYMALCVYAMATVFWLYILQRVPLSLAYPFSALAMVIVPIIAIYLFGEKLSWSYWIGVFFIFTGIIIIAR